MRLWTQRRASKLTITPPVPSSFRKEIALVAIMKNEEQSVADWIKFHSFAGVKNFILYDNCSEDNTDRVAQSVDGVKLDVIPWKLNATTVKHSIFLPPQILAYCHAISCFGHKYRWMSFIDLDEYLVPKSTLSLLDCLEHLSSFSNISLPWVMFGSNGHDTPPKEAAPYAYTQASKKMDGPLLNFKCIVDPCKIKTVSVHKFETSDMGRNTANDMGFVANNKRRASHNFISTSNLQLNHYYIKSMQDLSRKISGGAISGVDPNQRRQVIMRKLHLIEQNSCVNKDAVQFLKRLNINTTEEFRRGV